MEVGLNYAMWFLNFQNKLIKTTDLVNGKRAFESLRIAPRYPLIIPGNTYLAANPSINV